MKNVLLAPRMIPLLLCLVATALLVPASCFTTRSTVSGSTTTKRPPSRFMEERVSSPPLSLAPDQAMDFLQSSWTTLQTVESPSDVVPLLPVAGGAVAVGTAVPSVLSTTSIVIKSALQVLKPKQMDEIENSKIRTYPEGQPATYELGDIVPFEFGPAAFVRPLLKQTQLETRKLQVVYDANKDGYDAQVFHKKVDGKGAAVVLCKVAGQWCGGYNPRGWASLGSPRSSVAAFLFSQANMLGGWQKVRVSHTGSMACGNDFFDGGIQFGPDSLVIPLSQPNSRLVRSRLGQYFEVNPKTGRSTLMPRAGQDFQLQELYVLTGVYEKGEDIPNSGGVLELGHF